MYLQSLVVILCMLYSTVFIIGKYALYHIPPILLTGSRMVLAGVLVLAFQFFFRPQSFSLKKIHWGPVLMVALMGVYLTNILEFWGLQYMESAKASFLCSFYPIVTALLSYLWFQEKINAKQWLGLLLGMGGFIPLLLNMDPKEMLGFSLPEWAILLSTVTTAIGWIAMREVVKDRKLCPLMANGLSMLAGGLLSLLHSFCVESWNISQQTNLWPALQGLLLLTLVSNILCYNLHAYLLKHFNATYLSFAGLSQPFFTAFLAWFFLAEVLTTSFWLSLGLVTLGLYFYYREALKSANMRG
ncbi:MAG: DMT family transporter [Gammaproteobacteria bacterium]|nr:DMT family transporter [Gammaproteobacteria bacterium]MBP9729344.1 DMT family transporter [Gammaproteobacteria bacterium]